MMSKMMAVAATAFFLASGVPAAAFQNGDVDGQQPVASSKKLPDGTTAEERANTARLNAEQAARARAEIVTYEQEVAAIAQQVAHDQAEFADETAAYEAEKARVAELAAEERMKWEADVAACKAGDTSRCVAPTAAPR